MSTGTEVSAWWMTLFGGGFVVAAEILSLKWVHLAQLVDQEFREGGDD